MTLCATLCSKDGMLKQGMTLPAIPAWPASCWEQVQPLRLRPCRESAPASERDAPLSSQQRPFSIPSSGVDQGVSLHRSSLGGMGCVFQLITDASHLSFAQAATPVLIAQPAPWAKDAAIFFLEASLAKCSFDLKSLHPDDSLYLTNGHQRVTRTTSCCLFCLTV